MDRDDKIELERCRKEIDFITKMSDEDLEKEEYGSYETLFNIYRHFVGRYFAILDKALDKNDEPEITPKC